VGTYRGKDIKEIKKTNFIYNLLRIPYNKKKKGELKNTNPRLPKLGLPSKLFSFNDRIPVLVAKPKRRNIHS
jgi:hypothetical protein